MAGEDNPNLERFQTGAKAWEEAPTRVQRSRKIAAGLLKWGWVGEEWNAVEIGPGTGLLTMEMRAHLRHITVVDFSSKMLEELRAKLKRHDVHNVETSLLDLEKDPLPASAFDLAFTCMTLHHIPDTEALLRKLWAALRPGGHLAVADLDADAEEFHADNTGIAHFGFDRAALTASFERSGFESVKTETVDTITKEVSGGREQTFSIFLMGGTKPVP